MKTFFLVWNLNRSAPTVQHDTLAEAEREAARLARSSPQQSFYVVQAISHLLKTDVQLTRLVDDGSESECPF